MGKKRIMLPILLSLCTTTITTSWASTPQGVTTTKDDGIVSGQVLDETGQPLPGVTIRIDGSKNGVASDYDGRFSIQVAKGKSINITCSYIGCKTQKRTLKSGEDDVIIFMVDDKATLEEVVITGYQQIDRRNLTSSVTSVKMEDIARAGISSVDKMLQGRIPDLVLSNNSGEINSTPKIRIRGTSTLIGNREPLWVVDGIIINDPVNLKSDVINDPDYVNRIGNAISGINPQDIDRIDVLKDAAATALYGTRAANGVIVVTT
ncbi:outer membrane protein, partial [Segatella baroniae B14]